MFCQIDRIQHFLVILSEWVYINNYRCVHVSKTPREGVSE